MAITEESRFQLHQRLNDVLGEEHATTLMEHLPPIGWADVATKRDLDQLSVLLRQEMTSEFKNVRTEMGALGDRLEKQIAERSDQAERRMTGLTAFIGAYVTLLSLALGLFSVMVK